MGSNRRAVDVPSVQQILDSLARHPELKRELAKRLLWTCRKCTGAGEVWRDDDPQLIAGEQCPSCGGTGGLPPFMLTRTNMQHGDGGIFQFGRPRVEIDLRMTVAGGEQAEQILLFLHTFTFRPPPLQ